MRTAPILSLIIFLLSAQSIDSPLSMTNLCSKEQNSIYVDISAAKIQKISTYEYSLELYDSPVKITHNQSQIIFRGNFSKLILKNYALKKEFVYYGTEMVLKIPADHVFSMQNIPDLQLQIVHSIQEISKTNPYNFVMFSQLYKVSKFTNKIETSLSKYFNLETVNGSTVETHRIVRILEGFPMLMYKGSAETFPCRSDLLCLLKREYQLISHEDYDAVQGLLLRDGQVIPRMKSVKRKSLYEIQQIKKEEIASTASSTQL